jgi:hypothetical protein
MRIKTRKVGSCYEYLGQTSGLTVFDVKSLSSALYEEYVRGNHFFVDNYDQITMCHEGYEEEVFVTPGATFDLGAKVKLVSALRDCRARFDRLATELTDNPTETTV